MHRQLQKSVISPVRALTTQMRQLEQDQLHKLPKPSQSRDEIGQLSRIFYGRIAALIRRLESKANYDYLTRLHSRQKLLEDTRTITSYNIAIIDIDGFKKISSFLGVSAGDRVIKAVAVQLYDFFFKDGYLLYRLNSDEFVVIDPDQEDKQTFIARVQQFVTLLKEKRLDFHNEKMRVFVKAGIADNRTKQPLVSAMTALQYAKREQKDLQVYETTLSIIKEFVHNSQTTQLLQDVIKNRRVEPYFQPIYSIKEDKVTKYEALMRIRDEAAAVHSPATFLDVAKKAGLYRQLSKIMLEKSLHAFLDKSADVTLNISTLDVENGFVLQVIKQYLQERGHLRGVVFEITEQEGIHDFEVIRQFIGYVKSKGAKVALDDFGSGYSNFENLVHLQIDYLKIDGSLIKNLATDQNSRAIVETLVDFARKFDIETVAEFICDEAVAQKATQLGVDYLQGFYIAKPAPFAKDS